MLLWHSRQSVGPLPATLVHAMPSRLHSKNCTVCVHHDWVASHSTVCNDRYVVDFGIITLLSTVTALENGQTDASAAVLNEVIKPWFDGLPVTKVRL